MATLIAYSPGGRDPGGAVEMFWHASQTLQQAARLGRRDLAVAPGHLLAATRADRRCSRALARSIDSTLAAAARRLGGTAPDFTPVQPDDGERT